MHFILRIWKTPYVNIIQCDILYILYRSLIVLRIYNLAPSRKERDRERENPKKIPRRVYGFLVTLFFLLIANFRWFYRSCTRPFGTVKIRSKSYILHTSTINISVCVQVLKRKIARFLCPWWTMLLWNRMELVLDLL